MLLAWCGALPLAELGWRGALRRVPCGGCCIALRRLRSAAVR